jgi:hypothetical protein
MDIPNLKKIGDLEIVPTWFAWRNFPFRFVPILPVVFEGGIAGR